MIKVHFEIGHIKSSQETESVFCSNTLSACLKEFKEKNYNTQEYFIDVWETNQYGTPYPLGEITSVSILSNIRLDEGKCIICGGICDTKHKGEWVCSPECVGG